MNGLVAVDNRKLRIPLDPLAVDDDIRRRSENETHQSEETKSGGRVEGDPGDGLGDSNGVGIERGAHEPDVLAEGDDREPIHGVIAHRDPEPHHQRDEPVELAQHPEHGAAESKDRHQNRDQQNVLVAHLPKHGADAGVEGPGLDEYAEAAGAGEDHEDDVGRIHAAGVERFEVGEESRRIGLRLIQIVERAVNGDCLHPAVDLDLLIVVGSRWNHPGQSRHHQHDEGDNDVGVGHGELQFFAGEYFFGGRALFLCCLFQRGLRQ